MSTPYEKPRIISADEAILAELRAENERLRSCLSDAAENRRLIMGEYKQLREENAKLRAERDYLLANSNPTAAELRRVRSAWKNDRDENAKLRELVRALDWCTEHFDSPNKCDRCPFEQSDKLTPECEVRMRELGIEVG